MNNENKSIHEFDFNLICEYFSSMKRQGPGSTESTIKALSFIDSLTESSKIADLGCGTGEQSMVLAQHTPCQITGIDIFSQFIDLYNRNAAKINVEQRVKGITGSMDNLFFGEEELDIIWSEGSIYNIGFINGINYWKIFLKEGGYLAISEASWFTEERPDEINEFWLEAYPEIDTIPNKIMQLQHAGYTPIAHFILPENCWIENFYILQEKAQQSFLAKYPNNEAALKLIEYQKNEAVLYNKYKKFYGYVFYIAKKESPQVNYLEIK